MGKFHLKALSKMEIMKLTITVYVGIYQKDMGKSIGPFFLSALQFLYTFCNNQFKKGIKIE
jgi:hypothetical protein